MVTDLAAPAAGGLEHHVERLGRVLQLRGHTVAVASLMPPTHHTTDQEVERFSISTLAQRIPGAIPHPERPFAPPIVDPGAGRGLHHVVRRWNPDIIHGHNWLARSLLTQRPHVVTLHDYGRSCPKKDLRYLGTEHCSGPEIPKCLRCAGIHYGRVRGAFTVLGHAIGTPMHDRRVALYLPVSRAVAEGNELVEGIHRFRVIPNFIDDALVERPIPPRPSPPAPSRADFLFAGGTAPHKGLRTLLRAWALVPPPTRLLVAGDQSLRPGGPLDRVVFLGQRTPTEIAGLMRGAAGVVVPSTWGEPCPTVVLEAMASGTPVIASRVGGIPELITEDYDGLLVPPSDAEAIARAVQRLLTAADLGRLLGGAARQTARRFAASAIVPLVEGAYNEAIALTRGH